MLPRPSYWQDRGGGDELMQVSQHNLIAKIGADGVYGLGVVDSPDGPCGLAVKIEDGNMRLLGPLVCKLAAALAGRAAPS